MKRLYVYMLIVLEILVADNVYSQTTFVYEEVIVQSETASATSVYLADLDGDGDLDILSASQDDNKIAWYENDGSGNFGTQKIISVAAHRAHAVYAADLDGDGDTDVLSASWSDNKIAWYENDGAGNFGAQQIITTTAGGARSVYAADLDGDGDMDVLSASSQDDKIAWYENDGAGGFGTQQIISTTADYAISVYAADLDSDGDMDVLSASQNDNKIAWYENDGAGNFGAQQIISTVADGARSVYAADLDGDGDIDVLSASFNDDKLAWYENDGFGNFGIQQIIFNSPGYPQGIYAAYAADLDGDGDLDIISTALSEKKIAWQENDGTGNFGQQQIISTSAHTPISVYAADVDGDGDMDVLSASQYDDKIAWYENDGNGIFGIQQLISISATTSARSVYTADLDGDGDLDVLSASYWDNKIAWYENDGTGNFGTQQIITTSAINATAVYTADLDGDGDADVLSASSGDDKIAWYENDGAGNFGTQQIISIAANGARSVYAADLDGDGDLDVLSASSDEKIAWYENDGAGNFGTQQIISLATDIPIFVYTADLDGDGDLDVLSASYWDNKIAWYENDGTGNFGTQQIITTSAINATAVYTADLDGDGDADILSASSGDDKIAWYENDGAGNFGAQQIITTAANGARSVYAADIDGDGNLDVLSASQFDDKIAWYENDGLGNFGVQQIISLVANGAWSVYAADLDGDGDMDLLSASIADDKIAWYENLLYSPSVSDPLPPIAAFTTLPTPNATTTDTLIVCQGQPVQFLNQSENANAFMWEFGNGTTSTTANPSYTYPEPGTYEVTLTAYSNFPQPDVCEADAGEWVWGNVVGYTQNPDYVNIVVVSYENTVVQTFMMPLSLVDQQTIVNYYYQGIFNGAFYSVYSISYKPEEENPVIDFFNISSCMDIDTLTFCGYLQENVTTYLDEITGVYNTEIEVCKIPPVITYLKLTASDDSGVVVTDYGIFDNNCFAITIPNTQPGEVYELLIQECFNSICTDFFPSFICDTFITIPDTSPRPAQKDGESTASMVIVIEPGFAPQISCVATVCQGTIADYSTDADCETYLWEVSGGQILSGQGTPAISVEWTTPPLGSISLSAGCGEETCNQPTVAAVPVIGGTVTIEGQSNFCLNETLQYTAPYFGGTAYQWSIVPPSAGTILSGQGGNLITVQWGHRLLPYNSIIKTTY
ncbi:MAG: VCBS repeat-containing protein [Sphingobacteriales bacterium]|nr:MAG: VCBS repeat-containing protein [Sphingobacteriales bacterium]